MSKFGKELIEGLTEAVAFAQGTDVPDVRAIRRQLHMSQNEFADAFRIPLATLKNWEQGRRAPDAPAAAYLQAISLRPQIIREALEHC